MYQVQAKYVESENQYLPVLILDSLWPPTSVTLGIKEGLWWIHNSLILITEGRLGIANCYRPRFVQILIMVGITNKNEASSLPQF